MSLQISSIGPVGPDGKHVSPSANGDIPFLVGDKASVHKDKTLLLHRAAADLHCRNLQRITGKKVKRYTDDELAERAFTDVDSDAKGSKAFLYESLDEQCAAREIDANRLLERAAKLVGQDPFGLKTRGLDGATDTDLVGVDYSHEWFREMRLAGEAVKRFSRHMDIRQGFASWKGPVVGDALWLKQGPITANAYGSNTAYNPTSTSITLTPNKAMAIIYLSGELTEDSLAPIMENLKLSLLRGANVAIEHVLINGDSLTTTGNINSYAVTALGSLDARLMQDGLRALDYKSTVGKSAGAYSGVNGANAIVTLDAITGGLSSMGKWADDPTKVLTFINKRGEFQALQDAKARPDTYSALVRANDGRLVSVSGSQICALGNSLITNESSANVPTYASFLSEGYPVNLDSNGRYSGSGAFSGFVQVREDNILWGWKRQFSFKIVELPLTDQYALAATMRFCFVPIIAGAGIANSFYFKA